MSEDNQENGTANGDVPEIELIIKEEINVVDVYDTDSEPAQECPQQLPTESKADTASKNDEYIIFEVKTDGEPIYNYIIAPVNKQPPDDGDPPQSIVNSHPVETENTLQPHQNTVPYIINIQIPVEGDKDEAKENSPKSRRALKRKRLAEAVEAVLSNQLSITKAASVYQVVKSTLWKEVNKHTNYCRRKVNEDLNRKIADRICAGESLSGISRSLKIAKSTVHQHKVRLAQSGQLPSTVTLKPPVNPTERLAMQERIVQAYRGCRVNGMSIRFAAKFYSVSPSTLWKHIRRYQAAQKRQLTTPAAPEVESVKKDSSDEESDGSNLDMTDFHVDDYCQKGDTGNEDSEDGDFFISFDFDNFEEYVKRELE